MLPPPAFLIVFALLDPEGILGAAQDSRVEARRPQELGRIDVAGVRRIEHEGCRLTRRLRDDEGRLERGGKVLALGSVLNGDGRILTALSPLTHGNNIDARYADGSVTQVRIGHSDRAWDLALLVPKNARWRKGLRASTQPPLEAGSAALEMRRTYTTSDGEVAQVTVNTHPSSRYRHSMTMRRIKG